MKQLSYFICSEIKNDYFLIRPTWLDLQINPADPTRRTLFRRISAMIKLCLAMLVLSCIFFSSNVFALCQDGTVAGCMKNGKPGTRECIGGHFGPCMVDEPGDPNNPPPPPPSLHFYFGDLHSHTKFSDGASDIVDSFTSTLNKIRDFKSAGVDPKIDFMAITDHSGSLSADEFDKILKNANNFTLFGNNPAYPGIRFVAIPGFETSRWGGHENLFAIESNGIVYAGDYIGGYWESLWPLEGYVRNHNNIVQLNHPDTYQGTGAHYDFYDFTQPDQSQVFDNTSLIEIAHPGGNSREPQFFRALDRGWHVAPTLTSDWHDANLGERWNFEGRTAIVTTAPTLTREVIYSAMRERRIYATEDKNLEIDFRINNRQMGSNFSTSDRTLRITIGIRDPDPGDRIDRIELYGNNGWLLKTIEYGQGPEYRASFDLQTNPNNPGAYYVFMKVYQGDGQRAWTAPIRVMIKK